MHKPAAILEVESDAAMNLRATQPHPGSPPVGPAMKFTYSSGARPLDGYTIKRGVGRGGFGEVYYATSDAGKEVALKLIRRNLDIELRGVTHCLNLKHVNLLGLFDIRRDQLDDSWVVMEYVNGESLEDCLARHPNGLPVEEALTWFRGIAAGVAYLHDHGIVHRDLKPGNIFNDEGVVKIGDYGLSKFISASRRSGQTESVGTVHYMAPEIGQGRYGKEIDIYALGIVLYEVLTGQVPFDGESVGEVLMKHLTKEPDLCRVAEPFKSAIASTLAKDPEKRTRSVADLMAMLPAAPTANGWQAPHRQLPPAPAAAAGAAAVGAGASPAASAAPPAAGQWTTAPGGLFDEPFARGVVRGWKKLRLDWTVWAAPKWLKIVLIVGLIATILSTWFVWLIVGANALIAYAMYRGVRFATLSEAAQTAAVNARTPAAQPPPAPAPGATAGVGPDQPLAPAPVTASWHRRRRRQFSRTQPALPPKTSREQFTEWTGSLLISAAAAIAVSLVVMILRGGSIDEREFVWLSTVIAAGSWIVLTPAKWWEGREGDGSLRRFVLLVGGLALGAGAWALAEYLKFNLPAEMSRDLVQMKPLEPRMYDLAQPMAHMAYFGLLFALVRWWRQADPLRSTRISVWRAATTALAALIVMACWPYPHSWGLYAACGISLAVQLAAPFHFVTRSVYADD